MNLLAIETSSEACSVAVSCGEAIFAEHRVEARAHTRELVPMIRRQLAAAALTVSALDAVVLGNGPGSFIGMRIGASVAQGLAFGAGLPIVPVSSLAAVAAEVFARYRVDAVRVAQDARMGEVYCADYRRGNHAQPEESGQTALLAAAEAAEGATTPVAGAGWSRHPELLTMLAEGTEILPVTEPNARFIVDAGRRDLAAGRTVDPADLEPGYIRQTVAAVPKPQGSRQTRDRA